MIDMERPVIVEDRDIVGCITFKDGFYFKSITNVRWVRDMSINGKSSSTVLGKHFESNLPCADFATLLYCIRENKELNIIPRRIAHYFEKE